MNARGSYLPSNGSSLMCLYEWHETHAAEALLKASDRRASQLVRSEARERRAFHEAAMKTLASAMRRDGLNVAA